MLIALCDDDHRQLEQLLKMTVRIKKEPDTVACFSSGLALLEHSSPYPFDLTILDIEMPGLSGLDTARDIRLIAPETISGTAQKCLCRP